MMEVKNEHLGKTKQTETKVLHSCLNQPSSVALAALASTVDHSFLLHYKSPKSFIFIAVS